MDHQDLLDDIVGSLDNLPSEVRHLLNELRTRSEDFYEIRAHIVNKDGELKRLIRSGPIDPPPPSVSAPLLPSTSTAANSASDSSTTTVSTQNTTASATTTAPMTPANSANTPVNNASSTPSNADATQNPPANSSNSAQPSAASTTGLEWTSGAEAVEHYPDQKDAFWKIVSMFNDCSRISDGSLAIIDKAKALLDKEIKRVADELESHGVIPMGSANPIIPGHSVVPFVPLAAQTSLFATPGAPASASAAAAAAAAASSATPNAPPASKFLVQRSPSMTSAADILQTATEMAAAVVVESKAADAISGGGLSGGRPRGNTPDRNGNTTPKPNNPKRPLSSSFGVGALHPSISSPFLTTPTNTHGHHVLGGISGMPGSLGATMGLSPNKKRLKRKFEEGGSVGNSRHSGANSSSNAQSSSAAANGGGTDADEEVYCICQSVSYGEMIGCDSPECEKEWFHLACVGLKAPPDGVWLCPECVRLKAAAAAAALSASSGMGGGGDDLDDDDDDLDADDGSVKKSVFATAVTPLAASAVSASAASHHKKKRVR